MNNNINTINYTISIDTGSYETLIIDTNTWSPSLNNYQYDFFETNTSGVDQIIEDYRLQHEWMEISKSSKNNIALQKAIEQVRIIYYLSKEDDNS